MSSLANSLAKKRFAITGNPVMFSLSPKMMNHAFEISGIDAEYGFLPLKNPAKIVEMMQQIPLNGVNVTAPFKESVTPFLDRMEGVAKELGCINTIINNRDSFIGYNTDYFGVKNSINPILKKDDFVLLLGTGGAARSALLALRDLGANVSIWGRNSTKSLALSNEFGFHSIDKSEIENVVRKAKLIVNTIPPKNAIELLTNMHKNQYLFEASYNNTQTKIFAQKLNVKVINGESWLVYQGVEAFKIFSGISIYEKEMILGINANYQKQYKVHYSTANQNFKHFYVNNLFNSKFEISNSENMLEKHFPVWLSESIINEQEGLKILNNES